MGSVLDALHARWPLAQIGVSHVWYRGKTAECAALNGWIDTVLADGRLDWTYPGDDESVWLEGGDDGATMTMDGVHYSAAGQTEKDVRVRAAMTAAGLL